MTDKIKLTAEQLEIGNAAIKEKYGEGYKLVENGNVIDPNGEIVVDASYSPTVSVGVEAYNESTAAGKDVFSEKNPKTSGVVEENGVLRATVAQGSLSDGQGADILSATQDESTGTFTVVLDNGAVLTGQKGKIDEHGNFNWLDENGGIMPVDKRMALAGINTPTGAGNTYVGMDGTTVGDTTKSDYVQGTGGTTYVGMEDTTVNDKSKTDYVQGTGSTTNVGMENTAVEDNSKIDIIDGSGKKTTVDMSNTEVKDTTLKGKPLRAADTPTDLDMQTKVKGGYNGQLISQSYAGGSSTQWTTDTTAKKGGSLIGSSNYVNTGGTYVPVSNIAYDPQIGGSKGQTSSYTTSDGTVIAWNVTAIRQVSEELKKVSENFTDAHDLCKSLVPKINEAWESNLAAEKFEEKLDLGLVRHFLEGSAALSVLSDLLTKIADIYEDCENRIKNGDYGVNYRVGERVGGQITWANEGFGVAQVIKTGSSVTDAEPVNRDNLTEIEKKTFPLGLPVGCTKRTRTVGDNSYTEYLDSNGNIIGIIDNSMTSVTNPKDVTNLGNTQPETMAQRWGAMYEKSSDSIEAVANGATRISQSDLTEKEIANLKKIYKNGVNADVEFYRAKDGTLFTAVRNALGQADKTQEDCREHYASQHGGNPEGYNNQTIGVTVYKVEDGYLDMIAEMSEERVRLAQSVRREERREDLENLKFDTTVDYAIAIEDTPEPTPVEPQNPYQGGGSGGGGYSGPPGNQQWTAYHMPDGTMKVQGADEAPPEGYIGSQNISAPTRPSSTDPGGYGGLQDRNGNPYQPDSSQGKCPPLAPQIENGKIVNQPQSGDSRNHK